MGKKVNRKGEEWSPFIVKYLAVSDLSGEAGWYDTDLTKLN